MERRNAWVLWRGGGRGRVILDVVLWRKTLLSSACRKVHGVHQGQRGKLFPAETAPSVRKEAFCTWRDNDSFSCVHSERVALRVNATCLLLKPASWSISSWSNLWWKVRSYTVIYSISFLIKDGISGFSEVSDHRVSLWGQEFKPRRWRWEETSPLWSCPWHRWTWGCPVCPPFSCPGALHPYSSLGP